MRVSLRSPAWVEAAALLRRYRGPLVLALLLVVMNRLAALALPAASKYVVDEVIVGRRPGLLLPVALVVCTAVVVEAAAAFGAAHLAGVAGQRAIAEVRRGLQERVLRLPLRRIDAAQSGTLAARVMADAEQVRYLVGSGLVQLTSSVLTATLALAVLSWFNASAAFALLTILAVLLVGLAAGFRRIFATLATVTQLRAELTGRLVEVVGGARVVKAYVAERCEAHRFAKEAHRLLRHSIRAIRGISLFNAGTTLVAGAIGVLVLIVGGRAGAGGTMSLGSLVMYLSLTGFLLGPVVQIAAAAGDLGNAVAALERIAELRAFATEAEEDRALGRLPHVHGTVDFDQVSYAYVPGQLALREVSLHAPAGSTIALVGANGSGKSTLCRLLLAYDSPTGGRILVGGRDLAGVPRHDYRTRLGAVLQDDLLFDRTVAENIRYGRPKASLSEVHAVARQAHCAEFIELLPHGYSTVVGPRGARLSAGQRQRMVIARAFLANPQILVLDEATASLDAESEVLIRDAIRCLCQGRTTFIVVHDLTMAQTADQILVLDSGAVVERGRHEELLGREALYWKLYHLCREHSRGMSAGVRHAS
jgi:ABC-type multidrug transport system fused ATPase/permease subunit